MLTTDVATERQAAIEDCLKAIREITARGAPDRTGLDELAAPLVALTTRTELFAEQEFPVQADDGASTIYQLSVDPDLSHALYLVVEKEGNMSPPHDHTTWAVIAGIRGTEVNRLYTRTDDRATAGRAEVQEDGETVVDAGHYAAFMPDDIHSIHCFTNETTMNFHLYGRSIEHLPGRQMYNLRDGTCKVFPANPKIRK